MSSLYVHNELAAGAAMLRRGEVEFRLAGPADDAGIRRLLREQSMEGNIRLSVRTEPSFLAAAAMQGEEVEVLTAVSGEGEVTGLGVRTLRRVNWQGAELRVGHLSFLRVAEAYRRSRRFLRRGYEALHDLQLRNPVAAHLTAILKENLPARRLLEGNHRGMPQYASFADIETFTISVRRVIGAVREGALSVTAQEQPEVLACMTRNLRRLPLAPVDGMAAFESHRASPGWADFVALRSAGNVVAAGAVWDQRHARQLVVTGYSAALRRWRPLINLLRWAGRQGSVPAEGSAINLAYISRLAVDDPALFRGLLRLLAAKARQRGIEYLALSLPAGYALCGEAGRVASFRTESVLYIVRWDGEGLPLERPSELPYVEAALL